MVWRRVLVPSGCSPRELHGVFQVAMGWEGIHLYQFCLRAARYGSPELVTISPDVTLAALRFRRGAQLHYECRAGAAPVVAEQTVAMRELKALVGQAREQGEQRG